MNYTINVRAIVRGDSSNPPKLSDAWEVYDSKDGVVRADTRVFIKERTEDDAVILAKDSAPPLFDPGVNTDDLDVEIWVDNDLDIEITRTVGFDFDLDSFVSVKALEGTDPDTLHDQAIQLLKERLAGGDVVVKFAGIFDED